MLFEMSFLLMRGPNAQRVILLPRDCPLASTVLRATYLPNLSIPSSNGAIIVISECKEYNSVATIAQHA